MNRSISELVASKDPVIVGILNVTPDSFSDGGQFTDVSHAVAQAIRMTEEGAHIIDIGGESTRPGAQPVSAEDELKRVLPVIEAIREQNDIVISIDTSKAMVMREAVNAGATIVNDVLALQNENTIETCADLNVPVCLMHMQGQPRTMQKNPEYSGVVKDVKRFLINRADICIQSGIKKANIMLDPGFGFGKTLEHNLELLKGLDELTRFGYPIMIGVSRKSMFGSLLNRKVEDRLSGSLATVVIAYNKGARFFRVHDVAETFDVLSVCEAVAKAE